VRKVVVVMGRGRVASPVQGILVVNKEAGPSSNKVLQRVRRLLDGVKAGHAGTLDPEAEGVLLVCVGEATKLVPWITGLEKEYSGRMEFGAETDTYDATGSVSATAPVAHLTRSLLEEKMGTFLGVTEQLPPMFSAVKVGGERLYRLARRGEVVDRRSRPVAVAEFSLLEWERPVLAFRVRCGGGTYIRSLCHDLAKKCGSAGHMTALTRTAVGPFRIEQSVTVDVLRNLTEKKAGCLPLVPLAEALSHLPAMRLSGEEAVDVRQGKAPVPRPGSLPEGLQPGRDVKLVGGEGGLVAVVRYEGPEAPMPIRRVFA
jgi:tRNA pseudouridine55 synthase